MNENSTLLFIMDDFEGEGEIININDMLDPFGKCSNELEYTFKGIVFTPDEQLISNILRIT